MGREREREKKRLSRHNSAVCPLRVTCAAVLLNFSFSFQFCVVFVSKRCWSGKVNLRLDCVVCVCMMEEVFFVEGGGVGGRGRGGAGRGGSDTSRVCE